MVLWAISLWSYNMSHIPEMPEFDSGDEYSFESEEELKTEIAYAVLYREITDDNPSTENGCTALDQLIFYELDVKDPDLLFNLKSEVIEIARDLEEANIGCDEEEGLDIEMVCFNHDKIANSLADAILRGIITDDEISPWSGLTSLEQIICYKYGIDYDEVTISYIKRRVVGAQMDLRGGARMPSEESLDDTTPFSLI